MSVNVVMRQCITDTKHTTMYPFYVLVDIIGDSYFDYTSEEWIEKNHSISMIKLGIKRFLQKNK
jgi:hypothetical protein